MGVYVYDYFGLEMYTYGGKKTNGTIYTEIYWKKDCKIPEMLISVLLVLIEKGAAKIDYF